MSEIEFGQYLRGVRKEKNLGVREVARRAGISQAYLSQIETSKRNPGPDILYKIAKGLNVDHNMLFRKAWSEYATDESESIEQYKTIIQKALDDINKLNLRDAIKTLESAL